MAKLYVVESDLTYPDCVGCGRCCRRYPGCYAPEDFGDSPDEITENVRSAFASGRLTIDWWEGDPREQVSDEDERLSRGLFIRPAVQGMEGQKADPTYGGPCTFLGDNGCALAFLERPENCRRLMPLLERGYLKYCKLEDCSINPKQHYALRWLPYRGVLEEVGCVTSA